MKYYIMYYSSMYLGKLISSIYTRLGVSLQVGTSNPVYDIQMKLLTAD